jgi:DNA-binding transcriptional LysR family regulator
MELRHLRYFVAVAERLHFGRAAEALGIAQPSLSHQVRQLETELQTALLERKNRRVRLTEPGRLFLEEARGTLAQADRAAVVARRASIGEAGRLRVGFAYWMDVERIAAAVERLARLHPGISVELRSLSVVAQLAALKDGRLDAGFVRPPVEDPLLRSERLPDEPLVVALPATHRLAAKERLSLAALAAQRFILFPRESVPRFYDLVLALCRDAAFVPHVAHEADHPRMVLRLVAAGLGISLVPASARQSGERGVVFRSLRPPVILETAIAWRREGSSPLVERLVEAVREAGSTGRARRS